MDPTSELATLIHERSHSIIGNVTTYGTFQKGLALLLDEVTVEKDPQLSENIRASLDWVLDNAFYADEGYAMSRERDLLQLLNHSFDRESMPEDYEEALGRFDKLLSGHKPASPGMRLMLVQGLAEAIFNTDVLRTITLDRIFSGVMDMRSDIPEAQRPDVRLEVLTDMCANGGLLSQAEKEIARLIDGRCFINEVPASIDEAIGAAFATPGFRSDQALRLAYYAASIAVFKVLSNARPDIFNVGPEDAVASDLVFLEDLRVAAGKQGLALPAFKGARGVAEERTSEGILYAPQVQHFDVAWSLPDYLLLMAKNSNLFFFTSPGPDMADYLGSGPRVDKMLFLTPFALRLHDSSAEVAYFQVQLMVPIEDVESAQAREILDLVIDEVILLPEDQEAYVSHFAKFPDQDVASVVAILPNTDIETIESYLTYWSEKGLLKEMRLVTRIGPLSYFQVNLVNLPRVILRIPTQVVAAMNEGKSQISGILPKQRVNWEPLHHVWLEEILCQLIELGAFFGAKRTWHDDYVDDLIASGKIPDIGSFEIMFT